MPEYAMQCVSVCVRLIAGKQLLLLLLGRQSELTKSSG